MKTYIFITGRRCETGAGIYGFKCRRAPDLFRTLQQQIQLKNVIHDSVAYPVSRINPSPQSRQTLQASVVHRSSVDNGQPDPVLNNNLSNPTLPPLPHNPAPRSPSSADILEVIQPLHGRSQTNTHATNVYQVSNFKREHNNNQTEVADGRHMYTNDINRDLAMLRKTLRREMALIAIRDIEDETRFLEGRYMENKCGQTKSNKETTETSQERSEDANKLHTDPNVQQTSNSEIIVQQKAAGRDAARLYVNITPNEMFLTEVIKNETIPITPITPVTPKPVEYCNLTIGSNPEVNTYANLMIGEIADSIKKHEINQKFSESDTFTSMSPVEELEVNYAVLDIDTNKETLRLDLQAASPESQSNVTFKNDIPSSYSLHTRSRMVSQNSIDKSSSTNAVQSVATASIGYTTIDFDKTVALTSVAAAADANLDGRKSRHNSCVIICNSSERK